MTTRAPLSACPETSAVVAHPPCPDADCSATPASASAKPASSAATDSSATPPEPRFAAGRQQALSEWLAQILSEPVISLAAASEDASFRRYFRVITSSGQTYIVMDAPPEKEDCRPFLHVGKLFAGLGVSVPTVHAQNLAEGFLLLDDFGHTAYLQALSVNTVNALYGDALGVLERLHTAPGTLALELPLYDSTLLMNEMNLFLDWLTERLLGVTLSAAERQGVLSSFALLRDNARAQPQVPVHWDFHSRNLMVLPHGNPGVLDFQDAVWGPITYDLVSLLRDCYVAWPPEAVVAWLDDYFSRPALRPLLGDTSPAEWARWFDLMGIQRHLKASGIFARLWLRDGKKGYLRDIPRTLGYIRAIIATYPELEPLQTLLATTLAEARVAAACRKASACDGGAVR